MRMQGEILDSAHDFVVQLADIFDYVTPCFPEKYGIFRVIFREYHQHLSFMLDCIGCCSEQLSNSDILKVTPFCTKLTWWSINVSLQGLALGTPCYLSDMSQLLTIPPQHRDAFSVQSLLVHETESLLQSQCSFWSQYQ